MEMVADGLADLDVVEAILNAVAIHKTLRSRSPHRRKAGERLYVIQSTSYAGLFYSKGKLAPGPDGRETFHVLISAKRSVAD